MIQTKDLVEFVKSKEIRTIYHNEVEYVVEIVARLKEYDEMRAIIINPHLTQEHTMRDLLKLVKSRQEGGLNE